MDHTGDSCCQIDAGFDAGIIGGHKLSNQAGYFAFFDLLLSGYLLAAADVLLLTIQTNNPVNTAAITITPHWDKLGIPGGVGGGGGGGGGVTFCRVRRAHSVHRMSLAMTQSPGRVGQQYR